jgi:hypothetical protein
MKFASLILRIFHGINLDRLDGSDGLDGLDRLASPDGSRSPVAATLWLVFQFRNLKSEIETSHLSNFSTSLLLLWHPSIALCFLTPET